MKLPDGRIALPLGRTVRMAYQMDALRAQCSQVADSLVSQNPLDEMALEECARLEEALAQVQSLLRTTVTRIQQSQGSARKPAH